MATTARLTSEQRTELWNEKWKLLEIKVKVDNERAEKWKRTRTPNPPLDQERRRLYSKIKEINDTLAEKTLPKKFWEQRWFQGLITGFVLASLLSLGIYVASSNKNFKPDKSFFEGGRFR